MVISNSGLAHSPVRRIVAGVPNACKQKSRRLDKCGQMVRDKARRVTGEPSNFNWQPKIQATPLKKQFATGKKGTALRSRPPWQWALLLFGFWFASLLPCHAQAPGITEYQLKAAFIYNFVKFVDWPPQAFPNATAPYVIGVLGDNVFGDDLEQAITNKIINGRKLVFTTFRSARDVTNCQVLFISASERHHFVEILKILQGRSILTISENSDEFIFDGGMIEFVLGNDRRVRFRINNDAAKKAGLTISSDLLNLALPEQ